MREDLKKKYFFDHKDKREFLVLEKRILKVLLVVIFIKYVRLLLVKNENSNKPSIKKKYSQ